jgi:hypothetical protein
VLFDMDRVAIDTRESILIVWEAVAAERSVSLTAHDVDRRGHGRPSNVASCPDEREQRLPYPEVAHGPCRPAGPVFPQ